LGDNPKRDYISVSPKNKNKKNPKNYEQLILIRLRRVWWWSINVTTTLP